MKLFYYLSTGFDRPGPSYHLLYAHVADALAAGNHVFCYCTVINHDVPPVPEEFSSHPNFSYATIDLRDQPKSAFVMRYLSAAACFIKGRRTLSIARDYDVIFCQSSFCAPISVSIAKHYSKGKPVVYNVQDVFPGSSIASGVMTKKWMQHFFAKIHKIAYRKADVITVISEDMKRIVADQGVPEEKIVPIVNWFDDQVVSEIPWEKNRFVSKYNLDRNLFYVQYAGTTGYVFDYKAFLYAANALKEKKDIRFQIIAQGSQLQAFKDAVADLGLANIDFFPLEPQEMVSDVYSACDVCLIPLKQGVIGNSVPSKAGLLMACKRPVINSVDADSSYFAEFNDNKIGISVPNDDYEKLVEAILWMHKNEEDRIEMGQRAFEYGGERYSRSLNIAKYHKLFSELCSNRS